jgi:hypothetical protein
MSFVLSTVGDDFAWNIGIDEIFDLFKPFIFLANEIFSTEID